MGFALPKTKTGDLVCIFAGAKTPFLIGAQARHSERKNETHLLVGECFFHGVMDEKWVRLRIEKLPLCVKDCRSFFLK